MSCLSPRVLSVSLLLSALALGCATSSSADDDKPARSPSKRVGKSLPSLEVALLKSDGRTLNLAELRGKVVLLDIWASWCGPCKEEMPLLNEMAIRLKDKGIEIIAVSIDEERASAEAFLKSRKQWSLTLAHDPEGKVPEALKPPKMPTSYIVDSKGIVRQVNEGFERDDIARIEKRLLALAEGS